MSTKSSNSKSARDPATESVPYFESSRISTYTLRTRGYGSHQAISDFVKQSSKVLDIGCAAGYLMAHLRSMKNCLCVGIEQDHEAAVIGRSLGLNIMENDAISGVASLGSAHQFDHIVFGDFLEHLAEPKTILDAVGPLLNPKGSIIVSLPNIVSLRARITIALGVWRYKESGIFDKTHLRFYSVKTGRELLFNSGYKIDKEIFVGPLTFFAGRRMEFLTALRPNLLANQMIFLATLQDRAT